MKTDTRELHVWLYTTLDSLPRSVWVELLGSSKRGAKSVRENPATQSDPAAFLIAIAAVTPPTYASIFNLATEALAEICRKTAVSREARERALQAAELLKAEDRAKRAMRLTRALEGGTPRAARATNRSRYRAQPYPPKKSCYSARPAKPFRTCHGEPLPGIPGRFSPEGLAPREFMFYFVLCRLKSLARAPWENPRDDPRFADVVEAYAASLGEDPLEEVDAARRAFCAPFRQKMAFRFIARRSAVVGPGWA